MHAERRRPTRRMSARRRARARWTSRLVATTALVAVAGLPLVARAASGDDPRPPAVPAAAAPGAPATPGAAARAGAAPAQAAPAAATGRFRVVGTKILDPDGREFVAKGVNINGPDWVWPDDMVDPVHLDRIVDCWRFNLVRVPAVLFPDESGTTWDDNNDIERLVEAYTSRGVVVMIDAHDRIGGFYEGAGLTRLTTWYRQLATRFKDNPRVWFDIQNEPGRAALEPDRWLAVHRAVVRVIRDEVGAPNLLVAEGSAWGQDAGTWGEGPVPTSRSAILSLASRLQEFGGKRYDDIAFSIHVYDQWVAGPAKLRDYVRRVHAQGLALVVGEYGVQNAGQDTTRATRSMYEVVRPAGVGRIVWAWWGGDRNDLTTSGNGGGWHIDSCTAPRNLSTLGRMVWDDTHEASGTAAPQAAP